MDVGEHLELGCATNVVAIAAGAVADDFFAFCLAYLAGLERLNHAGGLGHVPYPFVAFDAHWEKLLGLGSIVGTGQAASGAAWAARFFEVIFLL